MDWFNVLEGVRKICPKDDSPFTSITLANALHFKAVGKKTVQQVSATWISKFVKWGYARRIGDEANPGHKPIAVYVLTKYGWEVKRQVPKLDQLRDLIRQYEAVKGTSKDASAWRSLISFCDQLDREEFGVDE